MTKLPDFYPAHAKPERRAAAIEREINLFLQMALDNFLENLSENIKVKISFSN